MGHFIAVVDAPPLARVSTVPLFPVSGPSPAMPDNAKVSYVLITVIRDHATDIDRLSHPVAYNCATGFKLVDSVCVAL
jgi:hypothetical protein